MSELRGRGGSVVLGIGRRGEYEAAEAYTADTGAQGMISFSLLILDHSPTSCVHCAAISSPDGYSHDR